MNQLKNHNPGNHEPAKRIKTLVTVLQVILTLETINLENGTYGLDTFDCVWSLIWMCMLGVYELKKKLLYRCMCP